MWIQNSSTDDGNVSCRVVGIEKFERENWEIDGEGKVRTGLSHVWITGHKSFFYFHQTISISHSVDSVLFTERAEFYWFFYFSHVVAVWDDNDWGQQKGKQNIFHGEIYVLWCTLTLGESRMYKNLIW